MKVGCFWVLLLQTMNYYFNIQIPIFGDFQRIIIKIKKQQYNIQYLNSTNLQWLLNGAGVETCHGVTEYQCSISWCPCQCWAVVVCTVQLTADSRHGRGPLRLGWAAAEQMVRKLDQDQPLSVPGSCGRARGCEQGGDDILIRTSRTFPWCCLYLYAWHFQSKLVSYLVSSAGEDDTFPTSFQPAREAKASKMVWCLSGKEKLNALTFDMVFHLNF